RMSAMLPSVPDTQNFHVEVSDLVDDYIRPNSCRFSRAFHQAQASAFGKHLQPVTSGDQFNRHTRRGAKIVSSNKFANLHNVSQSARHELHAHDGGGNSLSLPHDNSQRLTFS
ncbi:MAG TPA: hypothetical protein VIJ85_08475, partial [Rhizomicrobium sp.]